MRASVPAEKRTAEYYREKVFMYTYLVLKKRREADTAGLLIGDRGCGQERGPGESRVSRPLKKLMSRV